MTAQRIKKLTVEEYVELERSTGIKHEYHDGEVFALAGGTLNHSRLCGNIFAELRNGIKAKGENCEVFNSDTKLSLEAFDSKYVYPDVSVVCGAFKHPENFADAITNPVLLVEVLSESTASYDRGDKFIKYRTIDSFREYVLIEQNKPAIEIYYRKEKNNHWQINYYEGLATTFRLQSLNIHIEMKALYERVVFEQAS